MIPVMDKYSAKPKSAVKPPLSKMRKLKQEKYFNYRSLIGSLNFLIKSTLPEAQSAVHQCAQFSAYPKLSHDKAVKRVLGYLKCTSENGLIMKPDPEKGIYCYVDADFVGRCNQ